jgi:hypothetical protein
MADVETKGSAATPGLLISGVTFAGVVILSAAKHLLFNQCQQVAGSIQ